MVWPQIPDSRGLPASASQVTRIMKAQAQSRNHIRTLLTGLLNCLSHTSQVYRPKDGTAQGVLAPPSLISYLENASQTWPQTNLIWALLQLRMSLLANSRFTPSGLLMLTRTPRAGGHLFRSTDSVHSPLQKVYIILHTLALKTNIAHLFHPCPGVNSSPLGTQEETSGFRAWDPRKCGRRYRPMTMWNGMSASD